MALRSLNSASAATPSSWVMALARCARGERRDESTGPARHPLVAARADAEKTGGRAGEVRDRARDFRGDNTPPRRPFAAHRARRVASRLGCAPVAPDPKSSRTAPAPGRAATCDRTAALLAVRQHGRVRRTPRCAPAGTASTGAHSPRCGLATPGRAGSGRGDRARGVATTARRPRGGWARGAPRGGGARTLRRRSGNESGYDALEFTRTPNFMRFRLRRRPSREGLRSTRSGPLTRPWFVLVARRCLPRGSFQMAGFGMTTTDAHPWPEARPSAPRSSTGRSRCACRCRCRWRGSRTLNARPVGRGRVARVGQETRRPRRARRARRAARRVPRRGGALGRAAARGPAPEIAEPIFFRIDKRTGLEPTFACVAQNARAPGGRACELTVDLAGSANGRLAAADGALVRRARPAGGSDAGPARPARATEARGGAARGARAALAPGETRRSRRGTRADGAKPFADVVPKVRLAELGAASTARGPRSRRRSRRDGDGGGDDAGAARRFELARRLWMFDARPRSAARSASCASSSRAARRSPRGARARRMRSSAARTSSERCARRRRGGLGSARARARARARVPRDRRGPARQPPAAPGLLLGAARRVPAQPARRVGLIALGADVATAAGARVAPLRARTRARARRRPGRRACSTPSCSASRARAALVAARPARARPQPPAAAGAPASPQLTLARRPRTPARLESAPPLRSRARATAARARRARAGLRRRVDASSERSQRERARRDARRGARADALLLRLPRPPPRFRAGAASPARGGARRARAR